MTDSFEKEDKETRSNEENCESEEEFEESVLGTKEFWEDSFKRDLQVYQEHCDIGDIWFGKQSVDRVINWLEINNTQKDLSIIDVGCGNGAMLIALASKSYTNLCGVDYASAAIELASHIAKDENRNITFEVCDILGSLPDQSIDEAQTLTTEKKSKTGCLHRQYDICLDKGTYDAICLNPVDRNQQKIRYKENLTCLCKKDGGLFIITSCNWTKEELIEQFSPEFEVLDQIPTPVFQFGGKVGSRETVIVFKRVSSL